MKPAVASILIRLLSFKRHIRRLFHVLIMTVNPGFGGQSFIPHSLEESKRNEKNDPKTGKEILIEVDGGITLDNAPYW